MSRRDERGRPPGPAGRPGGRTHAMLPLSALSPPPKGPARLAHAVRVARVRDALGRELGRHVVDVHETRAVVRILFEDEGWARACRSQGARVAERLGPLGRGRRVEIVADGERALPREEPDAADPLP